MPPTVALSVLSSGQPFQLTLTDVNLLNETVGAGYLDRRWPEPLKASGAWPLQGLRQGFLNGS